MASDCDRRKLSGDESASGSMSPSTRCGPKARTQSAATTLLSMPPEMATTAPRRCNC
jgi:hypothetical protein